MRTKLIALFALVFITCGSVSAQTTLTKIGYTNVDYILGNLPEFKKVQNEIEVTRGQLGKTLEDKYKEYQDKIDRYQKNQNNMTELIRADAEKEIMGLQQSIQEFQNKADQDLQVKTQRLLEPIMDKINDAIQMVGKEENYLYILNMDAGRNTTPILLYTGSEEHNVTNSVLKKLGVDPASIKAETPATPAGAAPAPKK
jgi:outer membrane protein